MTIWMTIWRKKVTFWETLQKSEKKEKKEQIQ